MYWKIQANTAKKKSNSDGNNEAFRLTEKVLGFRLGLQTQLGFLSSVEDKWLGDLCTKF